jgi:hypothetical protein
MRRAISAGHSHSRFYWAVKYIDSLMKVEAKRARPDSDEISWQVRKLKKHASKGEINAIHHYGEYLMMPKPHCFCHGNSRREAFTWWRKAEARGHLESKQAIEEWTKRLDLDADSDLEGSSGSDA